MTWSNKFIFIVTRQLNNSLGPFLLMLLGLHSELIIVSENSSSDDKFHFVLEASRRSNMICLQLFKKEIEASPGESSALSLFSRRVSSHGFPSISNEAQVCCFLYRFEVFCVSNWIYCSNVIFWMQIQNIVRQLCTWRDLMVSYNI